MCGVRRAIEVGLVTRYAGRREARINIVFVAGCALHACVRARQRKRRCAVIERRAHPGSCVVADRAILGKPGLWMIRTRGAVVVALVTRDTSCRKPGIDVVFMTGCALRTGMRTGQRKGRRVVIERRSRP